MAVADGLHVILECSALQPVRQQYAPMFSMDMSMYTKTMRSFLHSRVICKSSSLSFSICDQTCAGWLKHCNISLDVMSDEG